MNQHTNPLSWTAERKASLKTWWLEERLSSTQIVELFRKQGFDTTRNAVIGAVHRSGWWTAKPKKPYKPRLARPHKPRREGGRKPPKLIPPSPLSLPPPPVPLRTLPEQPPPQAPLGEPLYLSVVQIKDHQCRYWYGESRGQAGRGNETGFCGHKSSKEFPSWCDDHVRLVYARPPAKEQVNFKHKF